MTKAHLPQLKRYVGAEFTQGVQEALGALSSSLKTSLCLVYPAIPHIRAPSPTH
jgi:hypothetical protein